MCWYGSWTRKKIEWQRIGAFELWCWRRLLWVLDSKGIKPVSPKGNQPWIVIGRTDVEAGAPILWPPVVKSWLIWKDPDAGKDWGQKEKGMTEDKLVGWYHWLKGHEFERTLGENEGQESLVCFSPWGHKSQIGLGDSTTAHISNLITKSCLLLKSYVKAKSTYPPWYILIKRLLTRSLACQALRNRMHRYKNEWKGQMAQGWWVRSSWRVYSLQCCPLPA